MSRGCASERVGYHFGISLAQITQASPRKATPDKHQVKPDPSVGRLHYGLRITSVGCRGNRCSAVNRASRERGSDPRERVTFWIGVCPYAKRLFGESRYMVSRYVPEQSHTHGKRAFWSASMVMFVISRYRVPRQYSTKLLSIITDEMMMHIMRSL
jgi:hypothetical protein